MGCGGRGGEWGWMVDGVVVGIWGVWGGFGGG